MVPQAPCGWKKTSPLKCPQDFYLTILLTIFFQNPGNSASSSAQDNQSGQMAIFDEKSSRQKGLEELDLLGESLLKQHLPDRPCSNQFKNEKIPLNVLQKKKKEQDLVVVDPAGPVQGSKVLAPKSTTSAFGSTASAYTKGGLISESFSPWLRSPNKDTKHPP